MVDHWSCITFSTKTFTFSAPTPYMCSPCTCTYTGRTVGRIGRGNRDELGDPGVPGYMYWTAYYIHHETVRLTLHVLQRLDMSLTCIDLITCICILNPTVRRDLQNKLESFESSFPHHVAASPSGAAAGAAGCGADAGGAGAGDECRSRLLPPEPAAAERVDLPPCSAGSPPDLVIEAEGDCTCCFTLARYTSSGCVALIRSFLSVVSL